MLKGHVENGQTIVAQAKLGSGGAATTQQIQQVADLGRRVRDLGERIMRLPDPQDVATIEAIESRPTFIHVSNQGAFACFGASTNFVELTPNQRSTIHSARNLMEGRDLKGHQVSIMRKLGFLAKVFSYSKEIGPVFSMQVSHDAQPFCTYDLQLESGAVQHVTNRSKVTERSMQSSDADLALQAWQIIGSRVENIVSALEARGAKSRPSPG
jgi:hypothetical protein